MRKQKDPELPLFREIGARIRRIRRNTKMGVPQAELAAALNVKSNTVSRWESGEFRPSVSNLLSIAQFFGVPLASLIPGAEEAPLHARLSQAAIGLPDEEIVKLIKYVEVLKDITRVGSKAKVVLDSYLNLAHAITGCGKDTLPVIDADTAQFMDNLLSNLDERSTFIIRKHFGLDGDPKMSLHDIGEFIGVTREYVRQIEAKALGVLRRNRRPDALMQFVRAPQDIRQQMLRLKSDKDFVRWAHPRQPSSSDDLELSVGAYNTLKRLQVDSLGKLPLPAARRAKVVAKYGKKMVAEIETQLAYFDLRLFAE